MALVDRLRDLSVRIQHQKDNVQTEEATKLAFVIPFLQALGYDVYNPNEIVPEYSADFGTKKGEKVDFAVMHNGKPTILFECKACNNTLDPTHLSQLFRYFTTTEVHIAILTNGICYQFFSDLESANVMDSRPFLEFNMLDIQESLIPDLERMTKSSFHLEEILTAASDLKYTREVKLFLAEQLVQPSPDFVKLLATKFHSGNKTTQVVLNKFTSITKKAFNQFLHDHSKRFHEAMEEENPTDREEIQPQQNSDSRSKSRRPNLRFDEIGIPIGSELRFEGPGSRLGERVRVVNFRKVEYQGENSSLTASTLKFLDKPNIKSVRPSPYWTYNGRFLEVMYNEKHG